MRGDEHGARLRLPGEEGLRRRTRDGHGKDRAHRGAHGFQGERIGRLADEDDARGARRIGRADDGAEIAGIAHAVERHPGVAGSQADVGQLRQRLLEDADDHLRIVAAGDRGEHLFADFEHQPAGATVRAAVFSTGGLPLAALA